MNIETERQTERKKYQQIYAGETEYKNYGTTGHYKPVLYWIAANIDSLVDVGCGDNSLAVEIRRMGRPAMGVDFVADAADMIAPAHLIPVDGNSYDWVTAFDMMEHLVPGEIDAVLAEFYRIARVGMMFSISYIPSAMMDLHQTIRPKSWWLKQIGAYGAVEEMGDRFIICRFE